MIVMVWGVALISFAVAGFWLYQHKGMKRGWIFLISILVLASMGYAFKGAPSMPDYPYQSRMAELAAKSPETLTPAESLARLQTLAQAQPNAPEPHYFIGQMMRQQGREQDALRAFQSALRRDRTFVPALVGLGDLWVARDEGTVSAQAQSFYAEAYRLDPSHIRAGFQIGLAEFQAGNLAKARAHWRGLQTQLDPANPLQQTLADRIAALDAALDAESETNTDETAKIP